VLTLYLWYFLGMIVYHNLPPRDVGDMSLNATTLDYLSDVLRSYDAFPIYSVGAEAFMVYGREIAAAILPNLRESADRKEQAIRLARQLLIQELGDNINPALLDCFQDGTIIGADSEDEAAKFKAITDHY
jgi:hypothetical protein